MDGRNIVPIVISTPDLPTYTANTAMTYQAPITFSDLVTSCDVKGFTPLHWAAYFGHEAVLELLLENEKLRDSWSNDLISFLHGHTDNRDGSCMENHICHLIVDLSRRQESLSGRTIFI